MKSCKYSKNIKVLIFQAEGRQALPVCKGFYEIGCHVTVYCSHKLATGYLTRYSDMKIVYKGEKSLFFQNGIKLIKDGNFDLVVPLSDEGAAFLSKNKTELNKYAKIAVNDFDVLSLATNKLNTMNICDRLGIPAPKSFTKNSFFEEEKNKSIHYPVVVKPQSGVGSIGFNIISNEDDLQNYLDKYTDDNGPLLIQEYIKQGEEPQYRADFYRDKRGRYRAATVGKVTRWYPLDGGSGIYVYTIHENSIIQNCKKLLDAMGWKGYANIDLVWDIEANCPKILEVNCRTGATIKIDYLAGINISQLILEDELDLDTTDYLEYPDNIKMSCFLPDLLWFIKSKNRFNAHPSWFDRRKVHDSIFSLDDPLPTIGFVITSVISYKDSMRKRKRY